MLELLFIHTKKTGGTTIAQVLKDVYGRRNCVRLNIKQLEFTVKPGGIPMTRHRMDTFLDTSKVNDLLRLDRTRVLLGHFSWKQVKQVPIAFEMPIITWLRDPVERVISSYYYKMKNALEDESKNNGILDDTLLEFASNPIHRNYYSQIFEGLPLDKLFFVGITEHLNEDLKQLGKMLGWPSQINIPQKNTNTTFKNKFEPVPKKDRAQILEWNQLDQALYEEALVLRNERINKHA